MGESLEWTRSTRGDRKEALRIAEGRSCPSATSIPDKIVLFCKRCCDKRENQQTGCVRLNCMHISMKHFETNMLKQDF